MQHWQRRQRWQTTIRQTRSRNAWVLEREAFFATGLIGPIVPQVLKLTTGHCLGGGHWVLEKPRWWRLPCGPLVPADPPLMQATGTFSPRQFNLEFVIIFLIFHDFCDYFTAVLVSVELWNRTCISLRNCLSSYLWIDSVLELNVWNFEHSLDIRIGCLTSEIIVKCLEV